LTTLVTKVEGTYNNYYIVRWVEDKVGSINFRIAFGKYGFRTKLGLI
jgi:hypothetical protein